MKYLPKILLLLAIAIPVFIFAAFPKWTVDDAYISYRYGVNLAETGDLTWNPGEKPVEGYTGIILPLLAALFHALGTDIPGSMQILGVLSWFGTFLFLGGILKRSGVNNLIISIALLVFSLNPIFYTHALSGLETMLFTFILTGFVFFRVVIFNPPRASWGSIIGFALVGLLLSLMRPEGMVVTAFLMAVSFFQGYFLHKKADFRLATGGFLLWALPMVIYLVWKKSYYGELLPNTWYAKRYQGAVNLAPLLEMGHTIMVTIGPVLLFLILLKFLFPQGRSTDREEKGRIILNLSLFCLPLLFLIGYLRSELFMNYSHRFFTPVIPAFLAALVLRGEGIRLKMMEMKPGKPVAFKFVTFAAILLGSLQLLLFGVKLRNEMYFTDYYKHIVEEEYIPVAETLRETLPPGSKVAIYMDAGVIPFRSGFTSIDFGKLNDSYLAHGTRKPEFVADYFFSQDPDAAVFTSFSGDTYDYIEEAHFIQSDRRFEKYRLFRKFNTSINFPYYQFIYLRTAP